MEIILGAIFSREFAEQNIGYDPRLRAHKDAIHTFRNLLTNGLLKFNSDLVETMVIDLICESPMFHQFYQLHRPKYYEDRTLKCRGSVTPEVRMYKCLTADFVVDFESYIKLNGQEECLNYLALSFLDFLKNLKYPGKLKKFEKEELLQAARNIFIENSILPVDDGI